MFNSFPRQTTLSVSYMTICIQFLVPYTNSGTQRAPSLSIYFYTAATNSPYRLGFFVACKIRASSGVSPSCMFYASYSNYCSKRGTSRTVTPCVLVQMAWLQDTYDWMVWPNKDPIQDSNQLNTLATIGGNSSLQENDRNGMHMHFLNYKSKTIYTILKT